MSRIGKKPITIPSGVTIVIDGTRVEVKGPKGSIHRSLPKGVDSEVKDGILTVHVADENDRSQRAFWGLSRALIANMVEGVTKGFEKKLEIQGVGYRAEMKGKTLVLYVGFSHPVEIIPDEGVTIAVEKNIITVSGIDKERIGETAANIRKVRKPEPYKGKGIRYVGEYVRQKAGKVVKASE